MNSLAIPSNESSVPAQEPGTTTLPQGQGAAASAGVSPAQMTPPLQFAPLSELHDTIQFASGRCYTFSFEQDATGQWVARIVGQPSYGGRADDLHSTRRLQHREGWMVNSAGPVKSYAEVKQVAEQWARRTERYIEHGIGF